MNGGRVTRQTFEELRADAVKVRQCATVITPAADVQDAIRTLAKQITLRLDGRCPIVMPVLLGGLYTAVRLTEAFSFPYEFDRVQLSRYGRSLQGGNLRWVIEPQLDLAGRTVLIVDDILDQGVTLAAVRERLVELDAKEVISAVLVDKKVIRPAGTQADFAALHCDDRFLFGCGMDYRGFWRGLPDLLAVAQS